MDTDHVYILGSGSVGLPLAVHLANAGRTVTAVRTSADNIDLQAVEVTVRGSQGRVFKTPVQTVSLAKLKSIAGTVVITAKAYANESIASRLREMEVLAPVVLLQNGIGVENPYLSIEGLRLYRCVLYVAGQKNADASYTFVPIATSRLGVIRGDEQELERLVNLLNTPEFPFAGHGNIRHEVWKKAIINSVFNSICPLLEVDNGIFVRDQRTALLATEVVGECLAVMQSAGLSASSDEIMQQIFAISKRSEGQLISTLQDIQNGRETEIDSLNLEIARLGEAATPRVAASVTRALGEMVKIKSMLRKT